LRGEGELHISSSVIRFIQFLHTVILYGSSIQQLNIWHCINELYIRTAWKIVWQRGRGVRREQVRGEGGVWRKEGVLRKGSVRKGWGGGIERCGWEERGNCI
jgi:hypothetical protein